MTDKTLDAYQRHGKHGAARDESEHIGPEGEIDWHGMYLAENRRAEKAEKERDRLREAAARRDGENR